MSTCVLTSFKIVGLLGMQPSSVPLLVYNHCPSNGLKFFLPPTSSNIGDISKLRGDDVRLGRGKLGIV